MTEWPLHHTISDFWSMVYDHEGEIILIKLKLKELESIFFLRSKYVRFNKIIMAY